MEKWTLKNDEFNREYYETSFKMPDWCETKILKIHIKKDILFPNLYTSNFWAFNRGITIFSHKDKISDIKNAKNESILRIKQLFNL